jgi:hypothetical protein
MQMTQTGKVGGLSPGELEAQARAELLPDRIEMHRRVRKLRKRVRRGNVICGGDENRCNRINT